MSAMLSVTQLEPEPEPEVFHEYLKLTPEMKWLPLSVCINGDVRLNCEIHTLVGAFKIRRGLYYFECFTNGEAKALDLIYSSPSNYIRNFRFARAHQKVPSAIPVSYLSKGKKNLAVAVLLDDDCPRASQKVVFCCSRRNEDAIFLHNVREKNNDGRTVSIGLLPIILRRPCCERGQHGD